MASGETNAPALILRDHLAADRTTMANERTFLAYVRTSLALFLTGASALHLPGLHPALAFGGPVYTLAGVAFIGGAVVVLLVGYVRYRKFRAGIGKRLPNDPSPSAD